MPTFVNFVQRLPVSAPAIYVTLYRPEPVPGALDTPNAVISSLRGTKRSRIEVLMVGVTCSMREGLYSRYVGYNHQKLELSLIFDQLSESTH